MTDPRSPDDPDLGAPDDAPPGDAAGDAAGDAVDAAVDAAETALPQAPASETRTDEAVEAEPPPVPPPPAPPEPARVDDNARMWASFCHLAGLVALVQVPGVVGSLVVWILKKDEHPFIDDQGKEALNFQINVLILHLIGFITVLCTFGAAAVVVVPIFLLVAIVPPILATIAASDGRPYRYPYIHRFVS